MSLTTRIDDLLQKDPNLAFVVVADVCRREIVLQRQRSDIGSEDLVPENHSAANSSFTNADSSMTSGVPPLNLVNAYVTLCAAAAEPFTDDFDLRPNEEWTLARFATKTWEICAIREAAVPSFGSPTNAASDSSSRHHWILVLFTPVKSGSDDVQGTPKR